jgi:hypothetical protein
MWGGPAAVRACFNRHPAGKNSVAFCRSGVDAMHDMKPEKGSIVMWEPENDMMKIEEVKKAQQVTLKILTCFEDIVLPEIDKLRFVREATLSGSIADTKSTLKEDPNSIWKGMGYILSDAIEKLDKFHNHLTKIHEKVKNLEKKLELVSDRDF